MNVSRISVASGERPAAPASPCEETENDDSEDAVKAIEWTSIAKQGHRDGSGQESDAHHHESPFSRAEMTTSQVATDLAFAHSPSTNFEAEPGRHHRHSEGRDHPGGMSECKQTNNRRVVHIPQSASTNELFDPLDRILGQSTDQRIGRASQVLRIARFER